MITSTDWKTLEQDHSKDDIEQIKNRGHRYINAEKSKYISPEPNSKTYTELDGYIMINKEIVLDSKGNRFMINGEYIYHYKSMPLRNFDLMKDFFKEKLLEFIDNDKDTGVEEKITKRDFYKNQLKELNKIKSSPTGLNDLHYSHAKFTLSQKARIEKENRVIDQCEKYLTDLIAELDIVNSNETDNTEKPIFMNEDFFNEFSEKVEIILKNYNYLTSKSTWKGTTKDFVIFIECLQNSKYIIKNYKKAEHFNTILSHFQTKYEPKKVGDLAKPSKRKHIRQAEKDIILKILPPLI